MSTLQERLEEKIEQVDESIRNFGAAVYGELSREIPVVEEARDSQALITPHGLMSYDELFYDMLYLLYDHEADRNAHNLTPAQLGSYTKENFDGLFTQYIPTTVSPFSYMTHGGFSWSGDGLKSIGSNIQATYTNIRLVLSGKQWDLQQLFATTPGRTAGKYYVFVQLRGGQPELIITQRKLDINYHRILLNVVTLVAQGNGLVHSWERLNEGWSVYQIDGARISPTVMAGTSRERGMNIPLSEPWKPLFGNTTLIWK